MDKDTGLCKGGCKILKSSSKSAINYPIDNTESLLGIKRLHEELKASASYGNDDDELGAY